jgi:hypothetical protein
MLRSERTGSRRLWETLDLQRFCLSLSDDGNVATLEGHVKYHFLHHKDSSTPETYADDEQWFNIRAALCRDGSIRPDLATPVQLDWGLIFARLSENMPVEKTFARL